MSFVIQKAAGRNLTLTQVRTEALRIGRGTNQEVRSENPALALEHAVITADAAGYAITDLGSITGTYVNRRPVETARLSPGDIIEAGDLRLEVQVAAPGKPLFLRIAAEAATPAAVSHPTEDLPGRATAGARLVRARRVDYAAAYRLRRPWLTKLSLTALLLVGTLTLIGEVTRPEHQTVFMPGGVSSAHSRAEDREGRNVAEHCDACHTAWNGVSNDKCKACHAQAEHAVHELAPPPCFDCHAEHRGASTLAAIPDSSCTSCHADLTRHVRTPANELASVRFGGKRYTFDSIARITGFEERHPEFIYPPDVSTLKFNHSLHLAGKRIFDAQGRREKLECRSCHVMQTTRGKQDPAPVTFERHCQRCHKLTFDGRFPDAEVPHGGDPGIVYGFVVATYSGDRDVIGKSPVEVRRLLSARKSTAPDQRALFNADLVFKTKCRLCHEIEARGGRSAVIAPVLLATWLERAGFTHGPHETVDCEKCHTNVRSSTRTSDVMMPSRADCVTCHGASGSAAKSSSCLTCHEYHVRSTRQVVTPPVLAGMGGLGSGGRMLQAILLAAGVILLLVVLVPVGFALYQRVRGERVPPAPAEPAAPKPPPPPMRPEPEAAAPPARPMAAAPPPDATTIMQLDPSAAAPSGGTEMMQWYGMLHCTQGPIEGQRFIIEDEGFYIGRDPALSAIVIHDNRISKRHVRIVPRDGKVWAVDQGSTNGTFMKGQRINEVQLKRGDTIVLADDAATFVYQI